MPKNHGHLLQSLLEQTIITKAIAVEKNEAPLKRTQKALKGHTAECVLGDGFAPLKLGVGDKTGNSASICGLGANTILQILHAVPEKLPNILILQANKQAAKLRRWGYDNGYHLIDECMVEGFIQDGSTFSFETNLKYGPHLLQRRDRLLLETIQSEYEHFEAMDASTNKTIARQVSDLKQLLDNFL